MQTTSRLPIFLTTEKVWLELLDLDNFMINGHGFGIMQNTLAAELESFKQQLVGIEKVRQVKFYEYKQSSFLGGKKK